MLVPHFRMCTMAPLHQSGSGPLKLLGSALDDISNAMFCTVDTNLKADFKSLTILFPLLDLEEISAIVLGIIKHTAEAYLGDKVTHTVVTVPTYFNNAQHQPPRMPVPSLVSPPSVSSTNLPGPPGPSVKTW
ncbi:ATPase with role in protein import into the ER, partial [Tulasnella sp. 417]